MLVGMMGAGKTAVGQRLANLWGMTFVDSDREIQKASRMSIADLFDRYGEAEFRSLERRIIQRVLKAGPVVLATGGGAFQDEATRRTVRDTGVSIWLKADVDVLVDRVERRTHRPLLRPGRQREILTHLLIDRQPTYALADLTIQTGDQPLATIVDRIVERLGQGRLDRQLSPELGHTPSQEPPALESGEKTSSEHRTLPPFSRAASK